MRHFEWAYCGVRVQHLGKQLTDMIKITSTGAEAKLVERLGALDSEGDGWSAVYFAFDRLLEHYRSDYQIKIALNLLKDLLKDYEGHLYLCKDSTIFLLVQSAPKQLLDKVIFQLRYLFMDDPLAYSPDGEENKEFCQVFDAIEDAELMGQRARQKMLQEGRSSRGAAVVTGAAQSAPAEKATSIITHVKELAKQSSIKLFNATSLASIEKDLSRADLSIVMRRQPICAAIPDMTVRRVFDELYINIAHLRQMMKLDVDLLSNRWLFKYLTELLDERMLHLIRLAPTRYLEHPVSLNLNVRSLMSDFFYEFDASVNPSVKVSVVIEIQISDVFEDMRGFLIARDAVQKMGYRVCLDGLSDISFSQIDREALGFDLVKLQWNADIAADLQSPANKRISNAIRRCGPNRVILTRCDNRKAVDYGQAMGVSLFQGRYLDKLMNPLAKVEN
ncbi:MAG: EAL domain-containing protein [Rickettsiales bacterium]|nr:EAL domain-containing protein [Rickettsiales bacterium]